MKKEENQQCAKFKQQPKPNPIQKAFNFQSKPITLLRTTVAESINKTEMRKRKNMV